MTYRTTMDAAWDITVTALETALGYAVYDGTIRDTQIKMVISSVMRDATVELLDEL